MKKLLSALLAILALYSYGHAQVRQPATQEERAALDREVRSVRRDAKAWGVVDLKGGGNNSVFVFSESSRAATINILERVGGRLTSYMQDTIWLENPGSAVENIRVSDMGNDGRQEVELVLQNRRRMHYIWNGRRYSVEDAMAMHGSNYPEEHLNDEIYYADLDGDRTSEAVILYAHEYTPPFSKTQALFSAYKWQHGWAPFRHKLFETFEREYENLIRSGPDVLALEDERNRVRNRIREYVRSRQYP